MRRTILSIIGACATVAIAAGVTGCYSSDPWSPAHYHETFLPSGLAGEIVAVNRGWGFVVVGIGDKAGARANAFGIVVRGTERIGKVSVTSVGPKKCVADVIAGTVPSGITIEPGDRVIFPHL
jgi:hypothetical protein